jgi:hypothetical protein
MAVPNNGRKYITFTYHDRAVHMITKLFRNTELKIAYDHDYTKEPPKNQQDDIQQVRTKRCVPIKMWRMSTHYTGQTGRPFKTR